MKETQVRNVILEYLDAIGAFVFIHDSVGIYDPVRRVFRQNRNVHRKKGVSDILGIFRKTFLAIEVKSKTGRLSPEQREFIDDVNARGGIAFMARSVDDVIRELKARVQL